MPVITTVGPAASGTNWLISLPSREIVWPAYNFRTSGFRHRP